MKPGLGFLYKSWKNSHENFKKGLSSRGIQDRRDRDCIPRHVNICAPNEAGPQVKSLHTRPSLGYLITSSCRPYLGKSSFARNYRSTRLEEYYSWDTKPKPMLGCKCSLYDREWAINIIYQYNISGQNNKWFFFLNLESFNIKLFDIIL